MLFSLKRDGRGLELSATVPYERKFLDAVQIHSEKVFKLQWGPDIDDRSESMKKIEMEIGLFQITLVTFALSMGLHSALKLFRLASGILLP